MKVIWRIRSIRIGMTPGFARTQGCRSHCHRTRLRKRGARLCQAGESVQRKLCGIGCAVIAEKKLNACPPRWVGRLRPHRDIERRHAATGPADFPAKQLAGMCEMFLSEFRRKHIERVPWNNYTAYEIRIIGALVQLGKRAEALELLEFSCRIAARAAGISGPKSPAQSAQPRSSGRCRTRGSHRNTCSPSRVSSPTNAPPMTRSSSAQVWTKSGSPRPTASPSSTCRPHGTLDLTMKRETKGALLVELGGKLQLPRGGFVARPPGDRAIRAMTINGQTASTFTDSEAMIRELPARVILSFGNRLT